MKIVVASGKGGVGKSMIASSLALLFSEKNKVVACDCDVDAPNMNIWLGVDGFDTNEKISTSEKAVIDNKKCIKCGKCKNVCRFSAIEKNNGEYSVNQFLCEGCGACGIVCPVGAISFKEVNNGEIREKNTKYGFPIIYGQLYPGEAGSGKVVEVLRNRSDKINYDVMIMDAAAGIGCPVIASLRDTNFVVLVTEPTPSGFSDLKRIMEIITHFRLPYGVIINKYNINSPMCEEIEKWAGKRMLGKIPYDKKIIESVVNMIPVIFSDSSAVNNIKEIFQKIKQATGTFQ